EHGAQDLLRTFFEEFWNERLREFRHRLSVATGDEASRSVRVLDEFLSEQGFMPEIEVGDDGITIRECNCPFPEAVRHTRLPCQLEAQFFERIFSEEIGRVSYIPDGSPACTYQFPEARETPC
ncbi:MAG: transcriptional regulator, partial [Rhodothermales bacterium]